MKYGSYGNSKVPLSQVPVKRGKKPSERKKDLNKLRKLFPLLATSEVEKIYIENFESIEDSILNLSCLASSLKDSASSPEALSEDPSSSSPSVQQESKTLDLLHEMFDDKDQDYIDQVFSQCNGDVSKTTAFIIESLEETEEDQSISFGSAGIGFVNKQALDRRCNQNFEEMVIDMFPNVSREQVLQTFNECNRNFVLTIDMLGYSNDSKEEIEDNQPVVKRYDDEYPDIIKAPKSKVLVDGYWSKDRNNHFLEGNNVDAVKKIKILKEAFPAVEDVLIKETFFQLGDDLNTTLAQLKEWFPENYRGIEQQETIFIPHPVVSTEAKSVSFESIPLSYDSYIPEKQLDELLQTMQREKHSHDAIFQIAANMAASGSMNEARKLSQEGKKHQKRFREIYLRVFREIFKRNNPNVESSDKIDLHGLQVEEALMMLCSFLNHVKGTYKKVEVVTVGFI